MKSTISRTITVIIFAMITFALIIVSNSVSAQDAIYYSNVEALQSTEYSDSQVQNLAYRTPGIHLQGSVISKAYQLNKCFTYIISVKGKCKVYTDDGSFSLETTTNEQQLWEITITEDVILNIEHTKPNTTHVLHMTLPIPTKPNK
jgi:hypothetical protein